MLNKIISASILSANFAALGQDVNNVLTAGADWIHFDVMDNHFVPNLTVGPLVCKSLRDYGISAPIDVHLMVNPCDRLITEFAAAGANWITIHPETNVNLLTSLKLIKKLGCYSGLALNPATPLDIIRQVYPYLDLILVMSVKPGFAGQNFIKSSLDKIIQLKHLSSQLKPNLLLGIDGGVNQSNIKLLSKLGIDLFVVGSSIFTSKNYKNTIQHLRELIT